jgi:cell wall-associated NlpC family hydrolase
VAVASALSLFAVSEARSATYSQVVDNTTQGRFSASSDWVTSNYSSQRYGANYRALKKPGSTSVNARYKIKTPAKASYRVFARWPANSGYNNRTRFSIKTSGGWKSKVVNQRQNGGKWVSLGTYSLDAGDSYRVRVSSKSSGTGFIIADAVKVVGGTTTSTTGGSTGDTSTTGADVVAEAKKHLGKPYVYGAAGPNSFDCSGFTQYVYKQFGKSLPHSASSQYSYGRSVSGAELKPGDLIFGNAGGSGIQHVGIYAGKNSAGNRLMIHAGTPETDVEITTYESWYNVVGYRRLIG